MKRTTASLLGLTLLLLAAAALGDGYLECKGTPQSVATWALSEVALVSEIRVAQEDYHGLHGWYASDVSSFSLAPHDAISVTIADATESGYSASILDTRTGLRCALTVDKRASRPEDVVVNCGIGPGRTNRTRELVVHSC